MRTRNYDFLDMDTMQPLYSFQARLGDKWCCVHDNGKPCLYTTQAERDAARAAMRKRPEPPK